MVKFNKKEKIQSFEKFLIIEKIKRPHLPMYLTWKIIPPPPHVVCE